MKLLLVVALACVPALAFGDVWWQSDMDTDAGWVIRNHADTAYTWGWDFTTMGIPASPGGSTTGLKMEANITAGAAAYVWAVTEQRFVGQYAVEFDMWINANGPFPGGGTGSTEFIGGGIGRADPLWAMNGGSLIITGEGGSSTDYRLYKNTGLQYPESGQYDAGNVTGANNNSHPYYADYFPGQAAPQYQQDNYPQQTGTLYDGTIGFAWRHMVITVDSAAGTANFAVDGLSIGTLDANIGSPFELAGRAQLIYADLFTSVSDNAALSFGVFDNFVITPEPTSLVLLALGGVSLLRRR
ncbi:MAG: PEP-CTERM sorting domain-containing protein [Planctomycetota bacterium]